MNECMKCPICGADGVRSYDTVGAITVEDYFQCPRCGYGYSMSYGPMKESIDIFEATESHWQSPERLHELSKYDKENRVLILPEGVTAESVLNMLKGEKNNG